MTVRGKLIAALGALVLLGMVALYMKVRAAEQNPLVGNAVAAGPERPSPVRTAPVLAPEASPTGARASTKVIAPAAMTAPAIKRGGQVGISPGSDTAAVHQDLPPKGATIIGGTADGASATEGPGGEQVDMRRTMALDEANRLYDGGDYDAALKQAQRVLVDDPRNVRMLRVGVSSACAIGEHDVAAKLQASLPPTDQEQMKTRCERYGVTLPVSVR